MTTITRVTTKAERWATTIASLAVAGRHPGQLNRIRGEIVGLMEFIRSEAERAEELQAELTELRRENEQLKYRLQLSRLQAASRAGSVPR